jgi:hypothetical protein
MRASLPILLAVSSLQVRCLTDQHNCDRSLATGDRLLIDVGAVVREMDPCDQALGIAPARQLQAQVTAFDGASGCASAVVMVDELGDWEITPRDQEAGGSHLLEAHYRLARGECAGSLHLDVTPVPVPTPPVDAGDAAELRVSYLADRDIDGCPLSCDASYRAHVDRR